MTFVLPPSWSNVMICYQHFIKSNYEVSVMDLIADAVAGLLQAAEVAGEPAIEDLAHVDVAELAVEPAEPSFGLGAVAVDVAAGDLVERFAAVRDAEPDRAREVGVEHEVADDPLRVDPVVVGTQVRLVGGAALQQARPVDQPQRRDGPDAGRVERRDLGFDDPADLVDAFEVAAELEEVEDLVARQ